MSILERRKTLIDIYHQFEEEVQQYKQHAICRAGCAFCCTHAGNVDVTTLEGLSIRDALLTMPPRQIKAIRKKIIVNRKAKARGELAPCPFLTARNRCAVYENRPFSCRQLYSIRPCEGTGPTLHRKAKQHAETAVRALQRLDDTGYSGHIAHILHLLDQTDFLQTYITGGFNPASIADFGKRNGILINRMVSRD